MASEYFVNTVEFRLTILLSIGKYSDIPHGKTHDRSYYPEAGKKPTTKLETESKALTKRLHMTDFAENAMQCTRHNWQGFGIRGLQG